MATLALLPILWTLLAPVPDVPGTLPWGERVGGTIDDGDAGITTAILAERYTDAPVVGDAWQVEAERSGQHCFDAWGFGLDVYLVLRDTRGEVVAEDDDGLGGTDARLVVDLDAQASYLLEVGALHGDRGGYELEAYRGEPDREHALEWPDEAVEARIRAAFVEEVWDKVEVVESEHYIVLTDGSAGESFGEILDEDVYEGFFEFYDLDAPRRHRPLFVYLFNTREAYLGFLVRVLGMSPHQAASTGGIAYRDYYATSYTSPRAPVHFHECAHQIMHNLLGLSGGGSWFQEGIAESYEDEVRHFNREAETNMLITTKQDVPLRELLGAESMLFSAGADLKGGGGARGMYGQAASVIQLLREERPFARRFHEFLFAMGEVPRGDLEAIERVLQEVYDVSVEELEAAWREHYEK